MSSLELLITLRDTGVQLTPNVATLRVVAPQRALTPALRAALREHKVELLDVMEEWSERAAIMEYCGGLSRPEAERLAWHCVLGKVRP
jgi:hypothetical protein